MASGFPRQIPFIVTTEACERLSYYGMLSVLTLYLKNELALGEDGSKTLVHLFKMAVYFLPLAGAWLADRWLGRYRTILSLAFFYCLGHGALALFEGSREGVLLGPTLIALGAGGTKPCVSAFVGDQFDAARLQGGRRADAVSQRTARSNLGAGAHAGGVSIGRAVGLAGDTAAADGRRHGVRRAVVRNLRLVPATPRSRRHAQPRLASAALHGARTGRSPAQRQRTRVRLRAGTRVVEERGDEPLAADNGGRKLPGCGDHHDQRAVRPMPTACTSSFSMRR